MRFRRRLLAAWFLVCAMPAMAQLAIVTDTLPDAIIGQPYAAVKITTSGATGPVTWTFVNAPSPPPGFVVGRSGQDNTAGVFCYGVSINGSTAPVCTGNVQGFPGLYNVIVRAQDSLGAVQKLFSFTLQNQFRITTEELPDVGVSQPFSVQLTAAGGVGPFTWQRIDGTLPTGITLSSSGLLSGTAPALGASYFPLIKATDANSQTATRRFAINVVGTLQITTAALPFTIVNQAMTPFQLEAVGGLNYGFAIPFGWTLPAGLALSSQGVLSGTPTVTGTYRFPIELFSSTQTEPVAKNFTLHVTLGPLGIVEADLPVASVNTLYQTTLTPSGGLPPYSWAFDTAATQGLFIGPSTGTITGTPSSVGSFPLPVAITDATGTRVVKPFTLVVPGPLNISTTTLPNAPKGAPYNQALTATGGQPPYTWSISSGNLPPGLTLDTAAGTISGTPTTEGAFVFSVTVTDFALHTNVRQLSITVVKNITISTSSLPDGTAGTPYSQTVTAVDAQGTVIWSIAGGALPAGLNLNAATGEISGTPTAPGTANFTIRAADGISTPSLRALTIGIYAPVGIVTSSLPNGSLGVAYSQTATASGGKAPYSWSISSGTPPPGLTLDAAAGRIQGIPTAEGVFSFGLTVTDAGLRTSTRQFSITVIHGVSITTGSLLDGTVGTPYSQTLSASGAQGTVTWTVSIGVLPAGLNLNAATGTISGTPASPGTLNFTIRASDGVSTPGERAFSLRILPPLTITTASLVDGITGVAYSQTLSALGAQGALTWSIISGTLPSGLHLDAASGVISGFPGPPVTATFTVRVTDGIAAPADRVLSITVFAPIAITTSSLADGTIGAAYSQTLTATGGQGTITWSVIGGTLPAGLFLNAATGVISGTPTAAGTANFTVRASDGVLPPDDKTFSILIRVELAITNISLADGITGVAYSQTLNAVGARGPLTWSIISGTLPAGLHLDAATGVISGFPGAPGTVNFTVRASDGISTPSDVVFSIALYAPLGIATSSLPGGVRNVAYSQSLSASGGKAPYIWSLFTGTLPDGLGLSAAGVISGTPTAVAVTSQFQVNVSDSSSQSALATFSIAITGGLGITTGNLSGSLGTAFSQTLAATGGLGTITWAITSGALPAGLQFNVANGAITGTPTAAGSFSVTFGATDQAQGSASKQLSITISAPALPVVSFDSLPASSPGARQPAVSVNLASPYAAAVTGTLTLTFASSVGGDDQTVQFSTGSRMLNFNIAAGATQATFASGTPAVLTGTVAGTITITAQFSAGGQNVTPTPAPAKTIAVELAAPVISTVTLTRSGSTLTVVVNGYATSREMVSGTYRFSATAGSTLSQPDFVVQLTSAFTTWFGSAASNATGGNFKLTVPFTIQGDATAVNLVSVTLVNTRGSSAAVGP